MSVAIAIASQDTILVDTMFSIFSGIRNLEEPSTMINARSFSVALNRNALVRQARELGVSHIMFVDSDMTFDSFGFQMLIDHDKDIVGGMYNKRQLPPTPLVKYADQKDLFEVEFIPTGFMLVNMKVFDILPEPWFYYNKDTRGEDQNFCADALAAGFKIYCEPNIQIKHLGYYPY